MPSRPPCSPATATSTPLLRTATSTRSARASRTLVCRVRRSGSPPSLTTHGEYPLSMAAIHAFWSSCGNFRGTGGVGSENLGSDCCFQDNRCNLFSSVTDIDPSGTSASRRASTPPSSPSAPTTSTSTSSTGPRQPTPTTSRSTTTTGTSSRPGRRCRSSPPRAA